MGAVGALLTSQNGSAMQWIPDVATGEVLTSGGTSTNPAYSATPTLGIAASTTGSLTLANGAASGKTVTIAPSSSMTAANWTLTLPTSAGSNTYVLSTDGSGNTSWVSQGSGATITLGVSASATNPQRSGQAGTGLFSATSNTVSVAENSTDVGDFASTGLNLPVATESYQINSVNALWQDNANFNLAFGDTGFPAAYTGGSGNAQYDTAVGYGR